MARRRKVWKPERVVVEWIDACEHPSMSGTLGSIIDRAKLVIRETVGYLVFEDDKRTLLARNYDAPLAADDEPEVDSILVIPTGWVLNVRRERQRRTADAGNSNRNENLPKDDSHVHQEARPQEGPEGSGAGLQRDGARRVSDPQSVPQAPA